MNKDEETYNIIVGLNDAGYNILIVYKILV